MNVGISACLHSWIPRSLVIDFYFVKNLCYILE